jgi:hypothetical protein
VPLNVATLTPGQVAIVALSPWRSGNLSSSHSSISFEVQKSHTPSRRASRKRLDGVRKNETVTECIPIASRFRPPNDAAFAAVVADGNDRVAPLTRHSFSRRGPRNT